MPKTASTQGARSQDLVPVLLRQAAAHGDLQAGPLLLQGPQLAEVAIKPVVGVFPNAAGIEDHDVGVLGAVGRDHPFGFEEPGQALGVVLVHLAPERAHEVAAGGRPPSVCVWPLLVRQVTPRA